MSADAPSAPKTLLALSRSPGTSGAAWQRLLERAEAAFARLHGRAPGLRRTAEGLALFVSETWPDDIAEPGRVVVQLSRGPHTLGGARVDAPGIARRLARCDVADLAPPFAACVWDGGAEPLLAATDTVGLRQLCWRAGDGWAGVATSSILLAALEETALDEDAVAAQALVGNLLGVRTLFRSVSVLAPGEIAALRDGRVERRHAASDATGSSEATGEAGAWSAGDPAGAAGQAAEGQGTVDATVAAGADAVRRSVLACLEAHTEPTLELSGGLDSRMVLAAVPRARRRGLRALTIGPAGSPDHRVAAALATRDGLVHERVHLRGLDTLAPPALLGLVRAIALARGCEGNALAATVLEWQEREVAQGPRLTGQNGEFARGFYYAAQRAHPGVTPALVDALARWRLFTNDAVDPALFAPGALEDLRARTLEALREILAGYGLDWLRATDEFYLRERMRRWVGPGYSSAVTRRVVQAPFFHPAYLAWARASDPERRRASRLFSEVLVALDPQLAAVPLDDGRTPRAIAHPGPAARVADLRRTGRKVLRKVEQRVRRRGKPATGAAALATAVREAWAGDGDALASVAALPMLDAEVVRAIAGGRRGADAATVSLLVNLDAALSATRP